MQRIVNKFLEKTVSLRTGGSILALASLLFVLPTIVHGATYQAQTSASGTLACIDLTDAPSGYVGSMSDRLFEGLYPDDSNQIFGGATTFPYTVYCGFDLVGQPVGDYWIDIIQTTGSDSFWGQFYWNGTSIIPVVVPPESLMNEVIDETNQTRLTSAEFTATSSNLSVDVSYFMETSEFVGQYDRPDMLNVTVYESDNTIFEEERKIILPLVDGYATTTLEFDTTIPDGAYFATINFWNLVNEEIVIPRVFITMKFTVSGGVVITQEITGISNALLPRDLTRNDPCGITQLSGCINNSFRYLFTPDPVVVGEFMLAFEQLDTKIPFVYLAQASTLVTSLYSSEDTTIPTISTPDIEPWGPIVLISEEQLAEIPYIPTIRDIISAGIWLMLFRGLYRRAMAIHDK